eukprot:1161973-Pelagomonas_calceolata.AAC.5
MLVLVLELFTHATRFFGLKVRLTASCNLFFDFGFGAQGVAHSALQFGSIGGQGEYCLQESEPAEGAF